MMNFELINLLDFEVFSVISNFSFFLNAEIPDGATGILAVEEIVQLGIDNDLIAAAIQGSQQIATTLLPFIGLMTIIRIGIVVADSMLRGTPVDIPSLAPMVLLFLFVVNYSTCVIKLYQLTDLLVSATDVSGVLKVTPADIEQTLSLASSPITEIGAEEEQGTYDKMKEGFLVLRNVGTMIQNSLMQGLFSGIMYALRWLIQNLQLIIMAVIIMLGPVAAFITSIPGVGDKMIRNWLSGFIAFKVWLVVLNCIDVLSVKYYQLSLQPATNLGEAGEQYIQTMGLFVYNLLFIVCYLMVPYLASLVIKSDAGGSIMGKAVEAAKTVKTGGASAIQGMMAAKAGGMSAVMGSSIGKKASKQEA